MSKVILKTIKGKKKFDELFKVGRSFREKDGYAVVKFRDKQEEQNRICTYYAVSAGRKVAKKAVVRNRIKRLLRESIRRTAKEKAESFACIEQIFLGWKKAPRHPKLIHLKEVAPIVDKLIDKAVETYGKKEKRH